MNAWVWSSCALLPPLGAAGWLTGRGAVVDRMVALQLTSSLGVALLMTLSFALQQASSIDLALTLSLLSLPGTLIFAHFVERWV